ncbi:MAG: EAL domain-containing protein [Selenomonadaceae bacterium]|nr:EAL domain-containing protein [Selenomonadaceae bacterium]
MKEIKFLLGAAVIAGILNFTTVESAPVTDNSIRPPNETEVLPETIMRDEFEKVKVGYVKGSGFLYEDIPGHRTGYGYEYMEFLSNYAHCDFEYVEFEDWESLTESMARNEIDVAPGMPGDYRQLKNATRTDHVIGRFPMELVISHEGVKPEMRIGNIPANYPTPGLAGIARGEGFTYETITYPKFNKMFDAFKDGEIDGYIAPMLNPKESRNVLAVFDRQSYRLSVRDDKPELLRRMNLAMDSMLLNQPNIRDRLNNKYLRNDGFPLVLSRHEAEYLAERKKLRAAIVMFQKPYAYRNSNGEIVGVMPEIINRISRDLGIEIELVDTDTRDNTHQFSQTLANTHELIKNGNIDFVTDIVCDFSWAKALDLRPTQSYLTTDYVPVTRAGYFDDPSVKPIVACIKTMFYTRTFIEPRYPEEKRLYVPTLDESLIAVSEGRADIAYVHRNAVTALMEESDIFSLEAAGESVYSEPISLGVYADENPMLWHILNKEISHIDGDWIRDLINKHQQIEFTVTPKYLIYHHPVRVFTGLVLLALAIGGFFVYRNRMRQKHFELVEHMAYTDLRYNLPNIPWLEHKVPDTLEDLEKKNPDVQTFFVVFSMDSSAAVTKDYGRKIIDKQFMNMAKGLEQTEPVILTAAGIDVEHMVCYCKAASVEDIMAWAEDMIKKYSSMETADASSKVVLHLRAGVSAYNRTMYVQQAVDRAVIACHHNSGGNVKVFDDKMEETLTMQHTIESRMEQALREGEFKPFYQPKYDIRTRRIVGAEALVRWISPELGFMPPGKFIPLFEQNGFVIPVDHYLLEKTCQLQRERLDAGKEVVPISVNQSRLHMIAEEGYLEKMQAVVDKYKLPAGLIELEVTETVFGDFDAKAGVKSAEEIINALHAMGFSISVDDFGSGYSSYTMLGNLPFDTLKVDRSILVGADTSEKMRTILANVISLGNSLKMHVITEGIETREQEELLLKLNCHLGQGFLNAKPMPVDDFIAFFEKRNAEVDAATSA